MLLLLCVFFSIVTMSEQAPSGRDAGQQLARDIVARFGKDARVLIAVRDQVQQIADRILDKLAEYAPNIKNAVIARQMLSPLDLERRFGLTGGNIFHGEITPDQSFNLRPVSGYADYRTPLAGLYLCGSGAHPGGGVTGIPGHNAAQVVIADLAG